MDTTRRPSPLASLGSVSLKPDLARATRATAAFLVPLVLDATAGLPVSAVFAAIAAQNVAQLDVRGAYPIRFLLLGALTLVLMGCSALGIATAGALPLALAGTALVALGATLWRHLCPEYAPGMIVSTSLLFLLGLAHPEFGQGPAVLGALAGGVIGLSIQTCLWPWRARHPLRQAAGNSWARAADVCALCLGGDRASPARLVEAENAVRLSVDQARDVLANAGRRHDPEVIAKLDRLNLLAARVATRAVSVVTAFDGCGGPELRRRLAPSLEPLFTNLTNCARSVAVAIVSRDPAHLAACEARLNRLGALIDTTRARLHAVNAKAAAEPSLNEVWTQLAALPAEISALLTPIIDRRADTLRFPRELLDLETWQLRPLAASLNLSRRVDPLLVRYALRLACVTTAGVLIWKHFHLHHGYWLPLTMFVVLQPDYGATQARALQRTWGTLAGAVAAGLLLLIEVPLPLRVLGIGAGVFVFAYHIKRRYAVSVFSVTIFVMLLLGLHETTSPALVVERVAITVGAGLATLLAAARLWPVDEHKRLREKLGRAFDASRAYVAHVVARLPQGPGVDDELIASKRAAERAAAGVFTTLNTLVPDRAHADETRRAAACTHGNQRLLRVANLLLARAGHGPDALPPECAPVVAAIDRGLELLGRSCGLSEQEDRAAASRLVTEIDTLPPPSADGGDGLHRRLLQAANEVRTLLAVW